MSSAEDTVVVIGAIASIAIGGIVIWQSSQGPPPPPPSPPPTSGGIAFLTYNDALTSYLTSIPQYLRSGDWFHCSTGNFGQGVNVGYMNTWADQIAKVCPGAVFVAHTGGQPNVDSILKAGLSSRFTYFALDWEPSEPGFTSTQSGTMAALQTFNADVHSHGLKSVGYMSGQGIDRFGWDYGQFGTVVDHVTVQTQGQEGVAGGNGPAVVSQLAAQFQKAGVSVSNLTCQATVGSLASGVTVTLKEVMDTYNAAVAAGCAQFFLEFAGGTESDLNQVLQAIGR